MITRTTIGADFEGALTYGAGVRKRDSPRKKAELIGSSNLGDVSNPRGLAAEMQRVADEQRQCKNPVWHTSLSWAKGEQLSTEQKLKAAERYCELLRSQLSKKLPDDERAAYNVWEQHQVAVYEHHDTDHEHIHIYLNRVPLGGGAAIQTGHNYKFNLKAIRVISEELNLNPLPSQRQSIKDSRPPVQDTRQAVRGALVEALANPQLQSIEHLRDHLAAQGIELRTKHSQAGQLVGVSFKQGEVAVTGQEVGMKAAQIREHYEPRQVQAQGQQPVAAQLAAAEVARPNSQAPPVAPAVQVVPEVTSTQDGPVTAPELPAGALPFTLSPKVEKQLASFGLSVAGLAATGQLRKLLAGEMTDTLAMNGGTRTDKPFVSFEGKLKLILTETGEVGLGISLPKKEVAPAPAISPVAQVAPRPQPEPAAPEQRSVAVQPTASKPTLKPEPPKPKTPRQRPRGPRR